MDEQKDAFVVKTHDVQQDAEYREWIAEIRRCYRAAQTKSAVKVNAEQLLFNWQLGRDLVVRRAEEKWGKSVVEQVSLDLQEAFPGVKGFSTLYIKKWYLFYTSEAELVFSFSKQTF